MIPKQILKCFIASPSDTSTERDVCERVFDELNRSLGVPYNVELQSVRWEKDVRPGIGEDGQAVINEQVGDQYDLFIGIMYTKFGSPTNRADSGTEEEFNIALERSKREQGLEIMFYFNDRAIQPSQLNIEQYNKVKAFRDNVVGTNCLYSMYDGEEDFKGKLKQHLTTFLNQKFTKKNDGELGETPRTSFLLEERLNKSLQLFAGQPKIWIDPIISSKSDISTCPDDNYDNRVEISSIIDNPRDVIISAPPQFGLTCLSNYMIIEAWKQDCFWLYLDAKKVKSHNIPQYVKNELTNLGLKEDIKISCVIVDEWNSMDNMALKKLKSICEHFDSIPIILMRTLDNSKFIKEKQEEVNIKRNFEPLYLLAMTRNQIRTVVTEYNKAASITDTDTLLDKIVSDLTTLNIHRTPQNCLTLLKADEKRFDVSPVNRSQMLEDVLYVLFEFTEIPRYNSQPDVKDCQFILGCFCERLIRENRMSFTREEFLSTTKEASGNNLIDIDVLLVFTVLINNNVITATDNSFCFKSAFWLLYFAARQMSYNSEFADYIFKSKKYLDYPELIEFYTGIDRNKTDALRVLMDDIHTTCDMVFSRLGIPDSINPYKFAFWNPTEDHILRIQKEISDNVMTSGLPESIKDRYSDTGYNQITPYNQSIVLHDFFEEYYIYNLIQEIKSSSRALRNSDYANPEIKKNLLSEVLRGWLQISKVLFALIPVLASKGYATYGGAGFLLSDNFGDTEEERAKNILFVISTNVIAIFKEDIFSSKIAPLLYDAFEHAASPLLKQQLALLFVLCRPNKWHEKIEKYLINLPKNSFYLFELVCEMRAQYKFGFVEEQDLKLLALLTKKCLAKHRFGVDNPSPGQVKQIPSSVLPKREDKE